jgi:hemerythrin-like metal-binding protein
MRFIPTGLARLDHAHAGIDRCLLDLGRAMQDRDAASARGWTCLLVQKLSEHFSDEEKLMQASRWPEATSHSETHRLILLHFGRFERELGSHGVTLELSYQALVHLPEILRIHVVTSDFGFAKFITGRAGLPHSRFGARPANASRTLARIQKSRMPGKPLS